MSSVITTSFTVACSILANDSMSLPFADDFDDDDSERESGEPVGRIGKQPLRRRADEHPALDVVKMFFDTFWIVRDGTTPNTVQARQLLEGFTTASVLDLFSSVFASVRVQSNGTQIPVSKLIFGKALNVGDCLPVGAQVLDQQFVGIVNDDGTMRDKRQRKVLTGGRFVSTEDEFGACAAKLLEMPREIFKRDFREICESTEMSDRDKTAKISKMLKQRIQERVERVRGKRAQTRQDRVASDTGAIASTSQPQTIVPRKNTGEVIDDEQVACEMTAEYLRSAGRLKDEDVDDFMTSYCLRNPALLNAYVKQANALHESHPEWKLSATERRSMLQREERRVGVSETQIEMEARTDATSNAEDTEMEDLDGDDDINQRINGPESGDARTNKDVSNRQRFVLQNIINEERVGGMSN